jgi:hypothetical protein
VPVVDDRVMLIVVGELLDHPEQYTVSAETRRELLSRLRELLEVETSKRPSHRPKDDTGAFVETLYQACGSLARAKRLVAKAERKTLGAVAKAYERYNNKRQK